jgi:hypothetical protein
MECIRCGFYQILLIIWALYMILAQPGLPACWLEARSCAAHTHFSKEQEETPHSHEYLFDLAQGQADAVPPPVIHGRLLVLMLALASGRVCFKILWPVAFGTGQSITPDAPPPKTLLFPSLL